MILLIVAMIMALTHKRHIVGSNVVNSLFYGGMAEVFIEVTVLLNLIVNGF